MAATEETQANGTNGATMPPPPINGAGEDTTTTTTTGQSLSAEEIAQYDRQIRLWGAQAQERIKSANILLVSLRALGTEIAKNLTLAGIRSLTIVDEEPVTEEDLGAQYFLREEDVGKPRAQAAIPRIQELNPRVTVKSGVSLDDLLIQDQTYYAPFDCVIACDHELMTLSMINTAVRVAGRPFYAAGIHGFYGYIFADLVAHEFVVERERSNVGTKAGTVESTTRQVTGVTTKKDNNGKTIEIVKKSEDYCPFLLANSSPLPSDVLMNRRKLKSVPALLPCLRALFDFQRNNGHLPGHDRADLSSFTELATQKSRELQLPPETLRADFLRSFIQNIGAEIVPTAAFVGGRLSEDVINVLGKREQPIQNFAMFDGETLEGRVYSLYTPSPQMMMPMNGITGMADGMMATGVGMAGVPSLGGMDGAMDGGIGMLGMGMNLPLNNGMMMPEIGMNQGGGLGALPQDMPLGNGVGNPTLDGSAATASSTNMPADAGAGGATRSEPMDDGIAAVDLPRLVPDGQA